MENEVSADPTTESLGKETESLSLDTNSGQEGGGGSESESTKERHNSTDSANVVAGGKDKDKDRDKINILLKPVGDAPILKNKLWAVPSERQISQITEFVKKYLKLEKHQNLFFFVNQLFAPAPDQCLRDLYECFGSDGKLILHYSTTIAWG